MPNITGKKSKRKILLESENSGNNDSELGSKKIRKSCIKTNDEDSIEVSKQLSKRIQSSGSSRIRTTRSSNKNNEQKICGNGKPMPSLAELEKMFEDSDGETSKKVKEVPLSPDSIKNIASRLMDKITNISDPTELIDELPPPPIVPQNKPKKSGIPYIIGFKERAQVIRNPNASFCKGDDYGLELNAASADDEDSYPKKRKKRSKKVNISKSIFNAKSDEIAEKLKENDVDSDGSGDNNKTVAYTYYHNPELSGRPQSFSPIPSTSRDNETILKNDKYFNESIAAEKGHNSLVNDVDMIDISNETIVIDDESLMHSTKYNKYEDAVEIIDLLDKGASNPMPSEKLDDEDTVQIIEPDEIKITNKNNDFGIDVDDYYSSIDINQSFDNHDVEEIKIDDLIRENNAIIAKFSKKSELNVITHIEPSTDKSNLQNKLEEQANVESSNGTNDSETVNNTIIPPKIDIVKTIDNRPSESHNIPTKTHNSPTEAHNNPHMDHSKTNLGKKYKKQKEIMKTIVRNFFRYGPLQNMSQYGVRLNDVNETIDLTKDKGISNLDWNFQFRQTHNSNILSETDIKSLTQLASSLQYEHGFNSIIVNLNNQSQQKQPATATDQTRYIPGISIFGRNLKPKKIPPTSKPPPQPKPPLTPIEESPKISKSLGDCPICMENLGNNQVASTVCGHVFCLKCIQAAVKSSGKKCPTCRKNLKGIGFHQLFL